MEVKAKEFKVPVVRLGQVVYWRPDDDQSHEVTPAIVTSVSVGGVLGLSLVCRDANFLVPKSAVRHARDPERGKYAALTAGTGVWWTVDE